MKDYEAMFILKPDLDKTGIDKVLSQIQELVSKYKGTISETKETGKNKLAYEIKKYKEGIYYLITFNIVSEGISAIKKNLALNESILRIMILEL
jgi:small subunit ribosomal protein S6